MRAGAEAPPGAAWHRGVSFPAFLVTLGVLLLLLFVALEFVNRWTRIPAPAPAGPAVRTALDLAVRALTKDAGAAASASGRLPPREAFRPALENAAPGQRFAGRFELATEVRPGTDALELRGILRSSRFPLGPAPGARDEIQSQPVRVRLRLRAGGPSSAPSGEVDPTAALSLLRARLAERGRKSFFVVGDAANRFGVGRIAGSLDRTASAPGGCAPPPDGCHVELTLDFADEDAVRLDPRGSAEALREIGPLAWGGLFDEVVYFVARGPLGRPPDYFIVNDPASLAYPRPYIAAAENIGGGRWEVTRVADDIENLQVAWRIGTGADAEWRADRPEARPFSPEGLAPDVRLLAVRIAFVAKGTERRPGAMPTDLPEDVLPFDAPRPRGDLAPIGWAANPRASIGFERETRYVSIPFGETR
jgi:hypothetical protein